MEQQPIRILQRPSQADYSKSVDKTPIDCRSLEEKRAAYAAARRRIMGSNSPGPEKLNYNEELEAENQQNGYVTTSDQLVWTNSVTSTTPTMFDQSTGFLDTGVCRESALNYTNSYVGTVQPYSCHTSSVNPNMATVNVANKFNQQSASKGFRQQRVQSSQKASTRCMTDSASSPMFGQFSLRNYNVPQPLLPSHISNAGLLPTPTMNVPLQPTVDDGSLTNGGLHQSGSHATLLSLMNNFKQIRQQYPDFFRPVTTVPTGFQPNNHIQQSVTHMNSYGFPMASACPNANHQKFAHQPTFN